MKIGFIGAGNMGGAIAKAVAAAGFGSKIIIADPCAEKAQELAAAVGGSISTNETAASTCDYVFLGVKPQVMQSVIQPLCGCKGENTVFVSMAAGVTIDTIQKTLGESTKVIRIMPNTPVSVGSGMIVYACSDNVSEAEEESFLQIMEKTGAVDKIPENLIDAACAVSGCGPAFVFMFAEALAKGGMTCGLPEEKALRYAAQMIYGAADLLRQSDRTPGELREAVCSPGGSTIRGVMSLEDNGIYKTVEDAVIVSYKRTIELG